MQTRKILFLVLFGLFIPSAMVFACAPAALPTAAPAQPTVAPAQPTAVPAQPTEAPAPTEEPTDFPNPTPTVIGECDPKNGECKLGEGIFLNAQDTYDPRIKVIQILENSFPSQTPPLDKRIFAVHSFVNFRILDGNDEVLSDFKENPMIITIRNDHIWTDVAISYCISEGNNPDQCANDSATLEKYREMCQSPDGDCATHSELFLFDETNGDPEKAWGSLSTEFRVIEPPMAEFVGRIETLEVGDPKVGCCRIPAR